jgi:PAS domain-containing protein
VVDPSQPVASTPQSPFGELRVALYASHRVDPNRLVLTTETSSLPLSGTVELVPFPMGADSWLLAIGTRDSLVGPFTQNVPWLLLAGGLVMALLGAAIVETLTRRRTYSLALVAERTSELDQTQAFLKRLLTAGPVLVKRVTVADRRITYVSQNVERILGVTEQEALAGLWPPTVPTRSSTCAPVTNLGRLTRALQRKPASSLLTAACWSRRRRRMGWATTSVLVEVTRSM